MKDQPSSKDTVQQAMLNKGERNKLIAMSVLLIAVVIAFATSQFQKEKHEDAALGSVELEPEFNETVFVPPFEAAESVAGKILDNRPEDRVLLPSAVLEPYVDYSLGFSDAQFKAMELELLTPELHAAITADPSAHRAKPVRLRGYLGDMKSHTRSDGTTEYKGWLTASSGEVSHFIVSELESDPVLDGFMRVDGLFLKLYRRKGQLGEWAEGPLFVGSRGVRSFPESEPHDAGLLASRLTRINDDSATNSSGLDGYVFDAQWLMMNYALSDAALEIDWEAEDMLELDNAMIVDLMQNGEKYRGVPIRIPVSKNMGIWTSDPGENPSRLDRVTTGWIGNWTWTNQAGVIKFIMPKYMPEFTDVELLTAKGFFLKNFNYQPSKGGTSQAPYFVLTELEEFIPQKNYMAENLMWGVMIITLALVAIFPILLMRDRKKSAALQRDLVRRKQERRRRVSAQA